MYEPSKKKPGRPRKYPPPTPFAYWLAVCDMTIPEVAQALGYSTNTIYGLSNGDAQPGRELGWGIEKLSQGAVPFTCENWPKRRK